MKHLRESQISFQTHPEIRGGIDELAGRLTRAGVTCVGKKLTTGMLINGLMLQATRGDPDAQLRRAILAIEALERWSLERPEPESVPLDDPPPELGRIEALGRPDVHGKRKHAKPKKGGRPKG